MKRPHLRIIADWRSVLRYAWGIRFIIVAGLFAGAEVVLPLIDEIIPIPPRLFAGLAGLCAAAALISRFIAQKTLEERRSWPNTRR